MFLVLIMVVALTMVVVFAVSVTMLMQGLLMTVRSSRSPVGAERGKISCVGGANFRSRQPKLRAWKGGPSCTPALLKRGGGTCNSPLRLSPPYSTTDSAEQRSGPKLRIWAG
jgi:hypothetical protein